MTACWVDADQQADRLAGIPCGVCEIGVEVDEALQCVAGIDGYDWRVALCGSVPVGVSEEFGGLRLREVVLQLARPCGGRRHGKIR